MSSFVVAMLSVNIDLHVKHIEWPVALVLPALLRCYFRYNCTYCLLLLLFSAKCSESPPSFQVVTITLNSASVIAYLHLQLASYDPVVHG